MEFIVLFPFWLFSNFVQKRKQFLNNLISGEYTFMFPSVTDYVLCLNARLSSNPKSYVVLNQGGEIKQV